MNYKQVIADMATVIRSQDNRCTAEPVYVVQQRRRLVGFDPIYTDTDHVWISDGDVVSAETRAAMLQDFLKEREEGDKDLDVEDDEAVDEALGLDKTAYVDQWEPVQSFFTERGADAYIQANRHNLKEPRVYVDSAYRNPEWQAIRRYLMALAQDPEPTA